MVWDWVHENANVLAGIGNLLMVAIWVVYLQLFYRQYCRQQRPQLVIHHAQGQSPTASCLLVNMSKEPVHVQCIMAEIEAADGAWSLQVTDHERISIDNPNAKQLLRQGPLQSGDFLLLGSFEEILVGKPGSQQHVEHRRPVPLLEGVRSIELRAVAIHGPSNQPVGARRRFVVEQQDDRASIRPEQLNTEQLVKRRDRTQLNRWLTECFNPSSSG